jgi:hypothetical protein
MGVSIQRFKLEASSTGFTIKSVCFQSSSIFRLFSAFQNESEIEKPQKVDEITGELVKTS